MRESYEDASQLQLHIWKQDLTLETVTRFQQLKFTYVILIRLVQEKLIKMPSLRKTQEDSQEMA